MKKLMFSLFSAAVLYITYHTGSNASEPSVRRPKSPTSQRTANRMPSTTAPAEFRIDNIILGTNAQSAVFAAQRRPS